MRKLFHCTMLILSLVMAAGLSHAGNDIHDRATLADLKVGQGVFLVDIAEAG